MDLSTFFQIGFLDDGLNACVTGYGLNHAVPPDIGDTGHTRRDPLIGERHIFGAHAKLGLAALAGHRPLNRDRLAVEVDAASFNFCWQDIHARRADEMPDKRMLGPIKELNRCADLHDLAVLHDDDLICEGQRLGLVMGHIDHGPL